MKILKYIGLALLLYIASLHFYENWKFIEWYSRSSATCCGSCVYNSYTNVVGDEPLRGEVGYRFDFKAMLVRPHTKCPNGDQEYFYQNFTDGV